MVKINGKMTFSVFINNDLQTLLLIFKYRTITNLSLLIYYLIMVYYLIFDNSGLFINYIMNIISNEYKKLLLLCFNIIIDFFC